MGNRVKPMHTLTLEIWRNSSKELEIEMQGLGNNIFKRSLVPWGCLSICSSKVIKQNGLNFKCYWVSIKIKASKTSEKPLQKYYCLDLQGQSNMSLRSKSNPGFLSLAGYFLSLQVINWTIRATDWPAWQQVKGGWKTSSFQPLRTVIWKNGDSRW